MIRHRITRWLGPRGVRIYRTGGPESPPWAMWNQYPGVTIGFAIRVAPHHLLSVVWRRA